MSKIARPILTMRLLQGDVEAGETESLLSNGNGTNGNGTNGNGNGYDIHYSFKRRTSTFLRKAYDKSIIVLFSNYVNFLLIFVPVGMASGFLGWNSTANFVLNFLAIIPLAAMLSFATEELSKSVGPTLGGLLNATFGNAVELIVRVPWVVEVQSFTTERPWLSLLTLSLPPQRSASLPWAEARFVSCRPACWEAFFRTSSWYV